MSLIEKETQSVKINSRIVEILRRRNFTDEGIKEFFSWDLKTLPNLQSLKDLRPSAERIALAIKNNEKIAVYGDYDVDGTTSCALLHHFFQLLETDIELIQPSRFIEGYGIHPPNIEDAFTKGVKVMVTVDCGITAADAAHRAKELGIDLIITDHHKDALEKMPDAFAIVNPNRRDEPKDSPMVSLAGVGVAFALAVEIRNLINNDGGKIPSLYPLLQFVAIGTISDLAKLNPMNLKLTRHGLKQMTNGEFAGIRSFISQEEREWSMIPGDKISFEIGPMINSKGRLEHPKKALDLLIAKNNQESFPLYNELDISNKNRKYIQAEVFKDAGKIAQQELKERGENIASIVYGSGWHEGVIGIVASKLVEEYGVPALVFTDSEDKDIIKASCRSAGELDLFSILDDCSKYFIKFGGHKAAAGLSMKKENYKNFKEEFLAKLKVIPHSLRTNSPTYDIELDAKDINFELARSLEMMGPFGMGNPRPIFKTTKLKIKSYDILKDLHVRWNLTSIDERQNFKGITFNYIGSYNKIPPNELANRANDESLEIFFTLDINRFKGNEFLQLGIKIIQ